MEEATPNYSAGVIKISDSTEQLQRSRHRTTKKPPPCINISTQFLWHIQTKMLYGVPAIPTDDNQHQYLGTLCLKDTETNSNMYHMYCCRADCLDRSNDRVIAHYRNKSNIKIINRFATGSVSALSLLDCVRKQFSDHKWNVEGNVLITDESYSERKVRETIDDIRNQQFAKFINYLQFLCNAK